MTGLPECALRILARREWFKDLQVFDKARLRVINLPRFFKRPPQAVAMGSTIIFTRPEYFQLDDPYGLAILAHEMWHIHQYHREGRLKFTAKYLREWAPLALRRRNIYEYLSYEKEAMAFQNHVERELRKEFARNAGQSPCLKEGKALKPNSQYRLGVVEPFTSG